MKPLRLNTDVAEKDLQGGEYPFAFNMVRAKSRSIQNEEGFALKAQAPYQIIGIVTFRGVAVVFSTDNTHSEIGLFDGSSYTTLINHDSLNFHQDSPIHGVCQRNYRDELICAFTDRDRNPGRIFNTLRIPSPFTADKILLFPEAKPASIRIVSVDEGGGALRSGTYYFFIRYRSEDNAETDRVATSQPVYITDDSTDDMESYDGCPADTPTSKAVTLAVEGMDTRYKTLILETVILKGGVYSARTVRELPLQASMRVTVTGSESYTSLAVDELLSFRPPYNRIGAMGTVQDKLGIAAMQAEEAINYQPWANLIRIDYTARYINPASLDESFKQYPGLSRKGFMHREVYAFYIRLHLKDGSSPMDYHIPGRAPFGTDLDASAFSALVTGDAQAASRYELEDTTDSAPTSNMGYWQNKDEFYPNHDSFDSSAIGGEDLRGKPVRHHRFPSLRTTDHYSLTRMGILGIEVSNVSFPDHIRGKVHSYEILYAKRSGANFTILAQDLLLYGATTADTNIITTSAGNYSINPFDGDDDINLDKRYIRAHAFDLLSSRLEPVANYLTLEAYMRKSKLMDPFPQGGMVSSGKEVWSYLSDYTKSENLLFKGINGDDYVRKVSEGVYLPHNTAFGSSPTLSNLTAEEAVLFKVEGDIPLQSDTFYTDGGEMRNNWFSFGVDNGFEETYLINLCVLRRNMYDSLYSQVLCSTGVRTDSVTDSVTLYGGDTFLSPYSFITYAKRRVTDNPLNSPGKGGVKNIHHFYCESANNIGLRHQNESIYSQYYPKTTPENLGDNGDGAFPGFMDMSENPNQLQYNKDYSALQDLLQRPVYNPDDQGVTLFPYRVHLSGVQGRESKLSSWRNFLATSYYEMPKSTGKVVNLQEYGSRLLIHCQHSLYVTVDRTTLKGDITDITIGSGEIFAMDPEAVLPTKEGYTGTDYLYSCTLTKMGYLWAQQGKVFLYSGGAPLEISSFGMRVFMRDYLSASKDNPFSGKGVHCSYDGHFNRIMISCLADESFTASFQGEGEERGWTSLHSYLPGYGFSLDSGHYYVKGEKLYLSRSAPYGYFFEQVYPSYVESIFTRGPMLTGSVAFQTLTEKGIPRYMETFSHMMMYNHFQCSGRTPLVLRKDLFSGNTRVVQETFHCNELRDQIRDREQPFIKGMIEGKALIADNITQALPFYEKRHFITPWVILRLEEDNLQDRKITLYEVEESSLPATR